LFASVIRKRFSRHHELSEEESVFLDVCSVLEDLGAFIEDGKEPESARAQKKSKIGILEDLNFARQ
jgi:hypothetical protein